MTCCELMELVSLWVDEFVSCELMELVSLWVDGACEFGEVRSFIYAVNSGYAVCRFYS